mmetsp:Transcript_23679/g.49340  ORF Transcript_23679/g.49340 Transcript_23679/m.49340 type:complete len:111 (-) Transcript_23679:43-375(-)
MTSDENSNLDVQKLNGLWHQSNTCYQGDWRIEFSADGESLTISEQPGSFCCFCVPNCIRKTHRMKKKEGKSWGVNYSYLGRLGGKDVFIEIVDENEIKHMTTDGLMIMRR